MLCLYPIPQQSVVTILPNVTNVCLYQNERQTFAARTDKNQCVHVVQSNLGNILAIYNTVTFNIAL